MFSFPLILILALIKYLEFQMWSYDFNERTIVETKGILNVTRTEIHYYRVKSIRIEEPLVMRILGLSNVYIKTSDPYQPELKLYAVPNGTQLRNQLRVDTDMRRKEEGVREYDLYNM
jgi:membrane protein YdbS with pleckstrin-like domain